jgi:hypothetical protein
MAAPLLRPDCAIAMFPSSLGVAGAAQLRTSCARTEATFAVFVVVTLIVIFSIAKFPRWAKLLPIWIGSAYTFIWVPLTLGYENASELAFKASGLTKPEWINIVSGDSRTRFSICASLLAALIVSLNAWVTRWESKNNN